MTTSSTTTSTTTITTSMIPTTTPTTTTTTTTTTTATTTTSSTTNAAPSPVCSENLKACTGSSDCISLDVVTDCTCYPRVSGCGAGDGVCLPTDQTGNNTPCTDDSNCPLLSYCGPTTSGSFCYATFPACVGEAPAKRMFRRDQDVLEEDRFSPSFSSVGPRYVGAIKIDPRVLRGIATLEHWTEYAADNGLVGPVFDLLEKHPLGFGVDTCFFDPVLEHNIVDLRQCIGSEIVIWELMELSSKVLAQAARTPVS
ncbi:uncharacterized protein Z519_03342 [Cladophialophora bantiana CBS 173.52]|uniref:Uncharacterized protein n=1 Tax=Cladophialophora bantiana (strain ATCC 10958 / CBS 173.52 / CDC B-1940 / NIH 8579) TaxID=1442370 RepID=A0A0D2IHS1_CLAB1|nr:uncharacterized protein Z519_03342 [Cladophialophora bantiana CBS 173.52]KIW96274.1 hypothetical protein Z519_03342 [Cladophialophora bantiana CBS 173.52]